jgi:uncharacterized damage-inducible protein DinB
MTNDQAEFLLQQVYLPQIQNERATTRRVIEAVPAANCEWKPDPKSMSALELAWHIASSECFFMNGVSSGAFNPGGGARPESIKTPADVLAWYDENAPKASAALGALKGDALTRTIDFHGVFNFPGIVYIGLMSNHSIHHRGQLSAYLRPMGAKVPRIYGGSADEPIQLPAKA